MEIWRLRSSNGTLNCFTLSCGHPHAISRPIHQVWLFVFPDPASPRPRWDPGEDLRTAMWLNAMSHVAILTTMRGRCPSMLPGNRMAIKGYWMYRSRIMHLYLPRPARFWPPFHLVLLSFKIRWYWYGLLNDSPNTGRSLKELLLKVALV